MPSQAKHMKSVGFIPTHYRYLILISENLHISFGVAVEFALIHGLACAVRGVLFFRDRVEASPGNRLASDDIWAAFQEWSRSYSRQFKPQISASDFAYIGNNICYFQNIAVRVRGEKVVCVGIRLMQVSVPSKEDA